MKLVEIKYNGVWSWENVAGAECREDALVEDEDCTADFTLDLALDAGVSILDVRFVDA